MDKLSKKINPSQVELESGGHRHRHFVLSLNNSQTIAGVREEPEHLSSSRGTGAPGSPVAMS